MIDSPSKEVRFRICPVCEAGCGLAITVRDRTVLGIRGNDADVFSGGYICPKGVALRELDADPDRLRQPLVRRDGNLIPATWDEAYAEIERRLLPIIREYGPDSVATYIGNPTAHKMSLGLYAGMVRRAIGTSNNFSAGTVDQRPKELSSALMYGGWGSIPVPDIERTDYLLILGANPLASNGSLWMVPDFRGKARALKARGGKLVVVDPRRSATAKITDEHIFIRPGGDAHLLAAMARVIFEEGLCDPAHLSDHVVGLDQLREAVAGVTPERAAITTGISAADIKRLARDLACAPSAAVYGRIGTTAQRFGTLTSFLVDALNVITGNLDRPGGAMFPMAPAFSANTRGGLEDPRPIRTGRRVSRVRKAPEVAAEFPVSVLAEEIETPGTGQVRGLITLAGNPVLSTPNSQRLSRALGQLDFMVSVDIYLNETTRHADVILPGTSPLEEPHYDTMLSQFTYKNVARYSPPIFDVPDDQLPEWEVILRLVGVLQGSGFKCDVEEIDDAVATGMVGGLCGKPGGPLEHRTTEEVMRALNGRRGPERLLDFAIRAGPYGDRFGDVPDGLTLAKLEAAPEGIDLGPLKPRIPECLRTSFGKVELAPALIIEDFKRLNDTLGDESDGLLMVGRRQVRSNNSWMHNLPLLAKGPFRCTMHIHPDDAGPRGITDGQMARIVSRVGQISVKAEVTDDIMPGVISVPHGWGHDQQGARLRVAAERPGANSNALADEELLDPVSGTAVLNGIPVDVAPA